MASKNGYDEEEDTAEPEVLLAQAALLIARARLIQARREQEAREQRRSWAAWGVPVAVLITATSIGLAWARAHMAVTMVTLGSVGALTVAPFVMPNVIEDLPQRPPAASRPIPPPQAPAPQPPPAPAPGKLPDDSDEAPTTSPTPTPIPTDPPTPPPPSSSPTPTPTVDTPPPTDNASTSPTPGPGTGPGRPDHPGPGDNGPPDGVPPGSRPEPPHRTACVIALDLPPLIDVRLLCAA